MSHARSLRLAFFMAALTLTTVLPQEGRGGEQPAGRKYALVVGVRAYDKDQLNSLLFTENDVNGLAAVLKDADYRHVVLMTQTEAAIANDNTLLPTAKNIRKKLAAILDDRKPEDTVLIAFSGHGVQYRDQKASYFCPMDADLTDNNTLVSLEQVYKALEESGAGTRVLLVDACRNDPQAEASKAILKIKLESVTRPQSERPPGGVAALFSCSEGQKSFESKKLGHGAFFYYVIAGLKGEAANKKGVVTLQRLAAYVSDEVPDAAKDVSDAARQQPQLVGDVGGSVPLVTIVAKKTIYHLRTVARGGAVWLLFRRGDVQTELKLTDDQKAQVAKITDKYKDDIATASSQDFHKMGELTKSMNADLEKSLPDILKPDQTKRLNQLLVQASGLDAFAMDEVKSALKLTDAQAKTIDDQKAELLKETTDLNNSQDDLEKRREAFKKMKKEALDKVVAGFSDDQKTEWKELTGDQFEFSLLRSGRRGAP